MKRRQDIKPKQPTSLTQSVGRYTKGVRSDSGKRWLIKTPRAHSNGCDLWFSVGAELRGVRQQTSEVQALWQKRQHPDNTQLIRHANLILCRDKDGVCEAPIMQEPKQYSCLDYHCGDAYPHTFAAMRPYTGLFVCHSPKRNQSDHIPYTTWLAPCSIYNPPSPSMILSRILSIPNRNTPLS